MHATDNALKVSRGKGCESALEIRLRISWPLSEQSEPFMPRFRVLGFVAKKRTRGRAEMVLRKTPEPLQNALAMRFMVKMVLRVVHQWYTPRTMYKRFSGAGWGRLGGVLRHPP